MLTDDGLGGLLDDLEPPAGDQRGDWSRVIRAARRPRRRALIAVAVIAFLGVLVAAPALGLRDQAVRLLGGGPPPANVETVISDFGGTSRRPGRAFVDLRTSVGARVTLFQATDVHGDCLGLAWSRLTEAQAGCVLNANPPRPLSVVESGHRVLGSWIALVFGAVAANVSRLGLISSTGESMPVPLSAHHFLVEVPRWAGAAYLVAYSADGLELTRHKLETAPSWSPPDPVGESQVIIRRDFANRHWSLYNYEAQGNRRCYGVEVTRSSGEAGSTSTPASNSFRCTDQDAVDDLLSVLGPDPWPSVEGSGHVLSVIGVVGANVAAVTIVRTDRTADRVAVTDGAFLYLTPDEPFRRPARLEAYGPEGRLLKALQLR
jgi:hypothetical protein